MSNTLINESTVVDRDATDANLAGTPIVEQFKKLQQMFVMNDTATTFGKSLGLLFVLIKESMILAWLALCWGIVGLSLAGNTAKQMIQGLKDWWNKLHELGQHQSTTDIATETAQSFFSKSQHVVQNLVVEAKKQVGLQDQP
jgi:hypothetical protein